MFLLFINNIGQFYIGLLNPHVTNKLYKKTLPNYWSRQTSGRWNSTLTTSSIAPKYLLDNHLLQNVSEHLFLGVTLDSKNNVFSLTYQIYISVKATRALNFIKRNLCKCTQSTKTKAYISMVHPILEYCSSVWDLHLAKDINELEKVQRRAARWTVSDYSWSSSVTTINGLP